MRVAARVVVTLLALAAPAAAQVSFRDAADRAAFRRWVVLLADAQFYRPTPDVTDCAGLVRHAVREALRVGTPGWRERLQLPLGVGGPRVEARAPLRDGSLAIFRVSADAPPRHAEFADARTLVRFNSTPLGRDLAALRPGDLLYFRQDGQAWPDHLMVFVGRSVFEPEDIDWVVYHTGPSAGPAPDTPTAGEVRKVRLRDLVQHPAARWRPVVANPSFIGIFRLHVLGP